MKLNKENIIAEGWEFVTNKNSGVEHFIKKYKDGYYDYIDGLLILTKPIDCNFEKDSFIKIHKHSFGLLNGFFIYIGTCSSIEKFRNLCKMLEI